MPGAFKEAYHLSRLALAVGMVLVVALAIVCVNKCRYSVAAFVSFDNPVAQKRKAFCEVKAIEEAEFGLKRLQYYRYNVSMYHAALGHT